MKIKNDSEIFQNHFFIKYYFMEITGKAPSIIANEIEDNDGIITSGSDVDLTFTENGTKTYLYGIALGNNKWEISELDDNLNIFPEYSESDVLSFDIIRKAITTSNLSQSAIFSFNLLGKVKYGLYDYGKKREAKKNKFKRNVKKITDFFTDDVDKETAQSFLRNYYPGANVGYIEKYNDIDGANFKCLWGVPSEKLYYVGIIHRNGNELRILDEDYDFETPLKAFEDSEQAYDFYEDYPNGKSEEPSENDSEELSDDKNNNEEESETKEQVKTDYIVDEQGNVKAPNKGYSGETEGIKWEVTQALKKKKKSKYNGCNVTGYEDGTMLNMASSSFHVFSRLLCINIIWQNDSKAKNYVSPEEFPAHNYIQKLENLGFEVIRYGKIVRPSEPSHNQSKSDLAIQFKLPNDDWIGTLSIKDSLGSYRYSYKGNSSDESFSIDNLDQLLEIPNPKD